MRSLDILVSEWQLMVSYIFMFVLGCFLAELFYRINTEKALLLGEKLDSKRDMLIQTIKNNLYKPWGLLRVIALIFGMNLFGGAILWSGVGGLLIVVPFAHSFLIGFLTNLVLKRYPERINWLTFPNIIFEVGAFMVSSVGAIRIGLSIFGEASFMDALSDWLGIFIVIVIPLQLVAAVFEGFLFKKVFVQQQHSWPRDI